MTGGRKETKNRIIRNLCGHSPRSLDALVAVKERSITTFGLFQKFNVWVLFIARPLTRGTHYIRHLINSSVISVWVGVEVNELICEAALMTDAKKLCRMPFTRDSSTTVGPWGQLTCNFGPRFFRGCSPLRYVSEAVAAPGSHWSAAGAVCVIFNLFWHSCEISVLMLSSLSSAVEENVWRRWWRSRSCEFNDFRHKLLSVCVSSWNSNHCHFWASPLLLLFTLDRPFIRILYTGISGFNWMPPLLLPKCVTASFVRNCLISVSFRYIPVRP